MKTADLRKLLAKDDPLYCPTCGQTDTSIYLSDITVWRNIIGSDDVGQLQVSGAYDSTDAEEENDRLYCKRCDEERPLPDGVEVDFL